MPAKANIPIGTRFGKLTVVEPCGHYMNLDGRKGARLFRCLCDCGETAIVRAGFLATENKRVAKRCCGCTHQTPTKLLPPVSKEDALYMAGFFDGEGTIGILGMNHGVHKGRNHLYLALRISSTDRGIMEWIQSRFLGKITARHFPKPEHAHYKHAWAWQVNARHAFKVLQVMYPYLIVKKREAEVALRFGMRIGHPNAYTRPVNRKGRPSLSREEVALRHSLRAELMNIRHSKVSYGDAPID